MDLSFRVGASEPAPRLGTPRLRGPASWWRLVAVAVAAVVVAAACGNDDGGGGGAAATTTTGAGGTTTTATSETPRYGGSIVVGVEAETNTWLPGKMAAASPGVLVYNAFYDKLMQLGEDGTPHPYAAESVTPNEDLSRWTVKLRPDMVFHDGTPVTAQIYKLGFDEFVFADGSNTQGGLMAAGVTGVEVIDDLTLEFVLNGPNAAFPDQLIGTPGILFQAEAAMADPEGFGEHPIGSGPFVFDSWTRDDKLVVKRFDRYWMTDADGNRLPYLDEITFRPVPDEDVRFTSVQSGDLTVGQTLRQTIVRRAREAAEAGDMVVSEFLGNDGGGAIFNVLEPPVDDARIRNALNRAVDQVQIIDVLGGVDITPPRTQYWSEDSPWYSPAVAEAWGDYDPDAARALLEEYMNDPGRSDGKPVGSPVAVTLNCVGGETTLIEVVQLTQAFWEAVGFDVTLQTFDQATHIQNALGSPDTDPPFRGSFMINCWRQGAEVDPFTLFYQTFGPVATTPTNFTNFTDPRIDEQLEILRTNIDFDVRYDAVEQIGFVLAEQVPNTWAGGTATSLFARPNVRGFADWTFPDGTGAYGTPGAVTLWHQTWLAS